MSKLAPILLTLGLVVAGTIWKGFALAILWAWFMVPTFGLPALSLAPAIGIALVVGLLTRHYRPLGDNNYSMAEHFVILAMTPAFALAIGWVAKQAM